jgi:hypothetical protein
VLQLQSYLVGRDGQRQKHEDAGDGHSLRVEGPTAGAGGGDEPGESAKGAQGRGDPREAEPVAGCWHG